MPNAGLCLTLYPHADYSWREHITATTDGSLRDVLRVWKIALNPTRREVFNTMRQISETMIVSDLAESVCERIVGRVVRVLQQMTDTCMSGADSGLANMWDEVCVQVQYQESFYWDLYDATVTSVVAREFAKLAQYEQEAIWLQSPEGEDWSYDDEEERDSDPMCDEEAVDYIVSQVYRVADDWTNPRMRRFLDQCLEFG